MRGTMYYDSYSIEVLPDAGIAMVNGMMTSDTVVSASVCLKLDGEKKTAKAFSKTDRSLEDWLNVAQRDAIFNAFREACKALGMIVELVEIVETENDVTVTVTVDGQMATGNSKSHNKSLRFLLALTRAVR